MSPMNAPCGITDPYSPLVPNVQTDLKRGLVDQTKTLGTRIYDITNPASMPSTAASVPPPSGSLDQFWGGDKYHLMDSDDL